LPSLRAERSNPGPADEALDRREPEPSAGGFGASLLGKLLRLFRDEPDETFARSLTEVSQSRQLQLSLCEKRRKRLFYQWLDQLAQELLSKPQTS
jgi:hypothetical protein